MFAIMVFYFQAISAWPYPPVLGRHPQPEDLPGCSILFYRTGLDWAEEKHHLERRGVTEYKAQAVFSH